MSKLSFFTSLVADELLPSDLSWEERQELRRAHEHADDVERAAHAAIDNVDGRIDDLGGDVEALRALVRAQAKQLKVLQAAIGVLATTLRDSNLVDADILDARLEAAVINSEEDEPRPAPKAKAKVGPPAGVPTVACDRCGTVVARNRSNVTEKGTLCDRCFATAT